MPIPILNARWRRRRTVGACAAVACVCGVAAACGGGSSDVASRDTSVVASPSAGTGAGASPTSAATGECRLSGAWQRCSVVESVERAGYRLQLLRDDVAQPGLSVRGAAYRVGAAELQVFLYADSAAAARAANAVDADDAEPADTRGILRAPAVIRSNNLVALLFDNNDRLRERVQLALAAGLPPD